MSTDETLSGELLSFRSLTPDGWGVGQVRVDREIHKVTGKLLGVQPGDSVELAGAWMDTKYGRQFKVRQCTATVPQTTAGVVAWMSSRLPDIGEKRALALVSRFGVARLWEAIETNPRSLCVIDGITPERADAIAIAYEENRADRDGLIALRGWGLTDKQVARCLEHWDSVPETVAGIRANPYVLMEYVTGFGFRRADDVAMRSGTPRESPLRIAAALHHVIGEEMARGHCYVPNGRLRALTEKLLDLPEALVAAAMRGEFRSRRLFVRGVRVYAPRLDQDEDDAAERLFALLRLQGAAA